MFNNERIVHCVPGHCTSLHQYQLELRSLETLHPNTMSVFINERNNQAHLL